MNRTGRQFTPRDSEQIWQAAVSPPVSPVPGKSETIKWLASKFRRLLARP
jgi:hypothetical protein